MKADFFSYLRQASEKHKIQYLVEEWVISQLEGQAQDSKDLEVFRPADEGQRYQIHFLIAIGGDGTILYASKQFHGDYIPPIIGFSAVNSLC